VLLKRGIVRADGLPHMTTIFGRRKKVSVCVYGEILQDRPEKDRYLPLVLESLVVGSGAFKRTENRRFEELDGAILGLVRAIERAADEPLRVHDMGASDGRTSAELYAKLRSIGAVDFTASDLYRTVHVVEPEDRSWWVAFDEDRQPIQYGRWGVVISPFLPDHLLLYPINRLIARWLEYTVVPRATKCIAEMDLDAIADLNGVRVGGHRVSNIALVSRGCRDLMRRDSGFRFTRHDVRQRSSSKYHLIRVLNVLNHVEVNGQVEAIQNCYDALLEGGILVIGRSIDPGGNTSASIWRREHGGFELIRDLHGGSEHKSSVIAAFANPAAAAEA
jgi:hypothetical protein